MYKTLKTPGNLSELITEFSEVTQQSPPFLAPGTSFMDDDFSTDR